MQDQEYFRQLLKGHLEDRLSPEEYDRFLEALRSDAGREILGHDILTSLENTAASGASLAPAIQEQILNKILTADNEGVPVITLTGDRRRRTLRRAWTAAAATLILAVASLLWIDRGQKNQPIIADSRPELIATNPGSAMLPIHLEDGSTIELQPGSRLFYPAHFSGSDRLVRLEGTAFFKIAPDPQRPFYAQSRGLVTHVLGTSFVIDWNQHRSELKVAVSTGKVEVHQLDEKNAGPVLTPNQQVIYTEGTGSSLNPTLVDSPQLIYNERPLIFKATPVSQIFTLLQNSYGINIVLEKEEIGKSLFTGDLSHQSFYTALKIICLSLNHSYVIRGTTIFITH